MNPVLKLLVLEDNPQDVLLLKEMLAEIETYELTNATFETAYRESLDEGIHYLETHPADIILLDLFLTDSQGLRTLEGLRRTEAAKDIPVIILTVLDNKETGVEAMKMGAQQFLVKSELSARLLMISIRYAIERQQLKLKLQKETDELKQSETRFIEIITNTPDGVIIVDDDKEILFMNPAAETLLGNTFETLQGKSFPYPIITDENQSKEIEIPLPNGASGAALTLEIRGVKIDWKKKDSWLISLRDITRKKKLMQAFQEEKEQLDFTLRSIADGVITMDANGNLRMLNWMATQMTGWSQEEAVGKPLGQIVKLKNISTGQSLENPGETAVNTGETDDMAGINDWVLISRYGEEIPCEFSTAPIFKDKELMGAVMVIRDVTVKKELEEETIRVQNLEALGLLAAGIAHQYSNILTATLGYISLAKMVLGENHKAVSRLKKAEEAALRAKEISYRLFTFAKGGEPRKKTDSVIPALKQAAHDAIETKYPHIAVQWEIGPDVWPAAYDPQQIQLAVRNILKNAVEALEYSKQEKIVIKIENIRIPGIKSSVMKRGSYVKITITDQGKGIAAEHLPKLFDAYFTTNEKAEGMGLTTAYSVVRKHGGWLRVKSKEGSGTTITLLIPAAVTLPAWEEPGEVVLPVPKESEPPTPGKKRILVMDDETLVREIAQEMLEFLEYEPTLVESGEETLDAYYAALQAGNPFDAVILDLVIPTGMGGKECIGKLKQMDPNVKAVVSSGYSDDPVIAHYRDYGFRSVLPKPYKIHELSEVLQNIERGKNNHE